MILMVPNPCPLPTSQLTQTVAVVLVTSRGQRRGEQGAGEGRREQAQGSEDSQKRMRGD